jgi:uncharacterized membrane protein
MNPLNSIKGTIISGLIIAALLMQYLTGDFTGEIPTYALWLHVLAGVTWIGLLYYFNFVQTPALAKAASDEGGPGGAGILKYVAPSALLWFRWGAVVTWLSGAYYLQAQGALHNAFTLQGGAETIGVGAWLGTIMLFNVWVLIWPNQKKILGIIEATAEQIAKAKKVAGLASRANTMLSIPMLLCMIGAHGLHAI